MQKQIYVSFFIITIFIFIIVGCGSDSNNSMITPSSDNQEEQNYGSLSNKQ